MKRIMLVAMTLLLAVFPVFASGQAEQGPAAQGEINTWEDWDFSGVTITVAVPEFGRKTIETAAVEFNEKTGGNVEVLSVSGAVWREKLLQEIVAGSGAFDIMDISPWWFGDFFPYLLPIDAYLADPKMTASDFDSDDIIRGLWDEYCLGPDGKYYGLPFWASSVVNYYRTDLFNDPAEKAAFKKAYGYELLPPTTWEEWEDAAEFFTRPDEGLYGATLIGKRAYNINVPVTDRYFKTGSEDWLDADGNPLIFTRPELMEEAFTMYLEAVKYAPADYLATEYFETTNTFISGVTAMAEQWSGATFNAAQDPSQSKVVGNVSIAPVPGGGLGGGHMWAITKDTPNPEASWVFLQLLTSKKYVKYALLEEGIDAQRNSVYADPDVIDYYADGYGENLAAAFATSRQPIMNKTPYSTALWEAMITRASEVISELKTPAAATEALVNDWKKILD
jgi:multiple sugar transport system substrate-binding protein